MGSAPLRAIGFDLGDTLFEYEGLPLSWVAHYDDALRSLAAHLRVSPSPAQLASGAEILRRYNTRLNPRDQEVPFRQILDELAATFGATATSNEFAAATCFFAVFRQRLRAFPDALPALRRLRALGLGLGGFTDVPYGMPTELVSEDLRAVALADALDVVMTSREAGFRKPAPATLQALATALRATPETFAYVGNEPKDIEAARRYGCRAVLLAREGDAPSYGQDVTIRSLADLEPGRV